MSLQKLLSLHKSMLGVQSYKTDDRDRNYNYSLKSYLNSVLNVHVPHWSGVVPSSVVSDGPSLIESCDFCMSMKLNNIGFVLHNLA